MQPKRFSELPIITDTDGNEIIPILKDGQNAAVETKNLPVSAATQTAIAEVATDTADMIEGLQDAVDAQITALDASVIHKQGDQTVEGRITFALPAIFPNGIVVPDAYGSLRRFFSATNGAWDSEPYTPPVEPPDPGQQVTTVVLSGVLGMQSRRRYIPINPATRRRGLSGVLTPVR